MGVNWLGGWIGVLRGELCDHPPCDYELSLRLKQRFIRLLKMKNVAILCIIMLDDELGT